MTSMRIFVALLALAVLVGGALPAAADDNVAAAIATAKSGTDEARLAAVETLGRSDAPEALQALHDLYLKDKRLPRNSDLFVAVLTAIGRHGDPSSVAVLSDKPFNQFTPEGTLARIYGLGNIRTTEAIDSLMHGMKLGGPLRGRLQSAQPYMPHFRTALATLIGQDLGLTKQSWLGWWNENKADFEIEEERPEIPVELRRLWEEFWGEPYSDTSDEEPAFPQFDWVMNPTKEQVKDAVARIDAARKSRSAAKQVAAIYEHMLIVDGKVVDAIRKIARRTRASRTVVNAAIEAAAWIPHKRALEILQGAYKRNRKLYKDEEFFAGVLKAIGRHSDPSSVKILLDKPFRGLTRASGRARILGVARIRTDEALAELMKAMRKGGGTARQDLRATGAPEFTSTFRLALVILTGIDKGENRTAWQDWWRDSKKTFKVSPERPDLPDDLREIWEEYWEEPYKQP